MTRSNRNVDDSAYNDWVKRQRSALTGRYSEYHGGEGFSIPSHVRRAGEAGTGYKPPFAAIPLTKTEHDLQSHKGERACLSTHGIKVSVEGAKDYFDHLLKRKQEEYIAQGGFIPEEYRK